MGGLNAAAKRTAFADVSNTTKAKPATSQGYTKNGLPNEIIAKGLASGAGKDAFRRPAQRPAKPMAAIQNSHKPRPSIREHAVQRNMDGRPGSAAGSKTGLVTVYSDKTQVQSSIGNLAYEAEPPTSAASMPIIRHYKSQPQLREEPPVLRRTQSRLLGASAERQEEALVSMGELTEALYEDALEHMVPPETGNGPVAGSQDAALTSGSAVTNFLPAATVDDASLYQVKNPQPAPVDPAVLCEEKEPQPAAVDPAVLYQEEKQPVASATVLSEPGEYWEEEEEEEEEEEVYDDQGYTTAHSFRSRGDLTTSGVTTLPFPKVTSRTLSELDAAKAYVEATRLPFDMAEDAQDLSMAAEYSEDIFQYMRELEVCLPHASLMSGGGASSLM